VYRRLGNVRVRVCYPGICHPNSLLPKRLAPHVGSWEKCAVDSFVDFVGIYIVCLASPTFSLVFPYLSIYLPFSSSIGPLRFQAAGDKMHPNLGLSWSVYFELQYFNVADAMLFCIVVNVVLYISLGLLYIFKVVAPGYDFVFWALVKKIGWEEHLQNDLYCVKWDVEPDLNQNQTSGHR